MSTTSILRACLIPVTVRMKMTITKIIVRAREEKGDDSEMAESSKGESKDKESGNNNEPNQKASMLNESPESRRPVFLIKSRSDFYSTTEPPSAEPPSGEPRSHVYL
ncbi:uncharacterized protein LOC132622824 [Lycium barbarum]|uniref:uncharacterized protein LOC132622824 n=1 Tax=Lycium barbarum TaxID=112863 RepID=UPI00293ED512|nr:uncharacterized protein LOC132622824 [Lycium barbarum]